MAKTKLVFVPWTIECASGNVGAHRHLSDMSTSLQQHTIGYGGSDTVAQLLALLALPPHSKKVMGLIPAWGAVGSGGQVLPRVHSAQVGYLPGLSVWSLHVLP